MKKTLGDKAKKTINDYLELPIEGKKVNCPYFNNKKKQIRGALRVYVGKGSPSEIIEETKDLAIKNKVNLKKLTELDLKKFIINNNIGIDCSGFVYHVLSAELGFPLSRKIKYVLSKNPLRKILANLRPAENISVGVLINEQNSKKINWHKARPGDLILWTGAGVKDNKNHVILIESVTYKEKRLVQIGCVHSLAWSLDGKYNHGVRRFLININKLESTKLQDQNWVEKNQTDNKNETLEVAKLAKKFSVRRLLNFS